MTVTRRFSRVFSQVTRFTTAVNHWLWSMPGISLGILIPQLGDGRAIYLGELGLVGGGFLDIQLKGSGHTPYSRNGDGLSALGPVLREYLVS